MRKLQPPTLLLGMVLAASSGAKTPAGGVCRDTTQYSVIEVPLSPSVISSTGVVAGTTELHRAAVWRREGGGVRELSIPAGFHYTDPVAVLKSGDIVINAIDAQARRRGA